MADVTLSVQYIDGTILQTSGFFNIEGWESESMLLTLNLFPRDNSWEVFAGSATGDHGSPKKLAINGKTYRCPGDANHQYQPSKYKNEAEPTTGGNTRKMTLQVRDMKSVTIKASSAEFEELRQLAET